MVAVGHSVGVCLRALVQGGVLRHQNDDKPVELCYFSFVQCGVSGGNPLS